MTTDKPCCCTPELKLPPESAAAHHYHPAPDETIKAARFHRAHEPLALETHHLPPLQKDEVHIRVLYAGINFYESMILKGCYPFTAQPPLTLGGECLGQVLQIGNAVQDIAIGDSVITFAQSGFGTSGVIAQQAHVKDKYVFKLPQKTEDPLWAALPMAYFTAWFLINRCLRIKDNNRVLIHSAAGGVGLAISDLLRAGGWHGLNFTGTCSNADKVAYLEKERGFDKVINVSEKPWSFFAQNSLLDSIDILLDAHGGPYFDDNLAALHSIGGQICIFGAYDGAVQDHEIIAKLRRKNAILSGFLMWPLIEHRLLCQSVFDELFDLMKKEKIKPKIDTIFPLTAINDAYAHLNARKNIGKILIQI
ncbi:MAG: zinc-binding dehydrogenase [Alphaproteobacteria bacterium]|nr:zinc-binding dehydrogenase [Alphaproteobacteria bacterium]